MFCQLVGEKITQDGTFRLSRPRFCNNCVPAGDHLQHGTGPSRGTCSVTGCVLHVHLNPGLKRRARYRCIRVGSATVRRKPRTATAPARRDCAVSLCHGCWQKTINMSAVPTAPQVFFSLLP